MIKTTIIALIEGRRYEFTAELAETAAWVDTADETAIGLLHGSMDQLAKAIERDETMPVLRSCASGAHLDCFRPQVCGCECHQPHTRVNFFVQADAVGGDRVPVDENGNRQCYLCGFWHDEPGSCATGEPTTVTAGPDDEPEYDGPTMDYVDDAEELDDDKYHGPEDGDYRESTFPTLDEILETGRPYCDDEYGSGVPANVRYHAIADAIVKASKRDEDSNASS